MAGREWGGGRAGKAKGEAVDGFLEEAGVTTSHREGRRTMRYRMLRQGDSDRRS